MKRKTKFFFREIKHFSKIRANQVFFILLVLVIVFLAFFSKLDENPENYTWIYSTSMQVLGALIALLPISYSFYLANIDKTKSNEFDSYVLETLKKDGYYELMFVITVSVLTIVVNLVFFFLEDMELYALIAAFLSLLSIQLVSIFIYQLFDPERANIILKKFDVQTDRDTSGRRVSLDEFTTEFEELIVSVKDYITRERSVDKLDKMPFYDVIDKHHSEYKLVQIYYDDFKEIIFHRNNVIANYTDVMVDYNKYVKVLSLKKEFTKANEQFVQVKLFNNVSVVRNIIDDALSEYLAEFNSNRNNEIAPANYQIQLSKILKSKLKSKYYNVQVYRKNRTTDFEVIQNNYSNKKLIGIDFKVLDSNRFNLQSKSIFRKLSDQYLYLFTINFNQKHGIFEVAYLTKDKKMRFYIK